MPPRVTRRSSSRASAKPTARATSARRPRPIRRSGTCRRRYRSFRRARSRTSSCARSARRFTSFPARRSGTGEGNRDQIVLRGNSSHRRLLHRRHSRRHPIFPRLLQRRADGGPQGPERDDLRPRRRRRHRQPGHQALDRSTAIASCSPRATAIRRHALHRRHRPAAGGTMSACASTACMRMATASAIMSTSSATGQSDPRHHRPARIRGSTSAMNILHDRRTADRGVPSLTGRAARGFRPHLLRRSRRQLRQGRCPCRAPSRSSISFAEGLTLRNRTLLGDYDKFYQNIFGNGLSPANPPTRARSASGRVNAYNNATERRNLFSQTDLIWENRLGGIDQTMLFGFEIGAPEVAQSARETGSFAFGDNRVRAQRPDGRRRPDLRARSPATPTTARGRPSPLSMSRTRSASRRCSRSSPACASTASSLTSTTSRPR